MSLVPLTKHSTLGVAAGADRVVTIAAERDLQELLRSHRRPDDPAAAITVLGGGSNVVLRRHVAGTVCLMRSRGFQIQRAGPGAIRITAAAGERWHDLVRFSLAQGFSGIENLALIPGSVGAAPIQNIGAYGCELAERFVSLRALDRAGGRIRVFRPEDCRFGYRDSVFKSEEGAPFVIIDVTLELHQQAQPKLDYPDLRQELERLGWSRPTPVQVAEAVIRVRRRKLPDPRFTGNAGSFFKNPVVEPALAQRLSAEVPGLGVWPMADGRTKVSAAALIDDCGWKGYRRGNVGVWHRQPLVLCNFGGASGQDVLALSEDIRADVRSRFGVDLEREPQVIGYD